MTDFIKKLPSVFQTTVESEFFDATFDQVFSKKDSSLLSGFIGRRNPGTYNPITDFYLPEPTKNRTWWQLEPTAFARNDDTTKANIFFYEDLLDNIEYYGGNTLNQDRLFESEYYSFGPPIDYDMFINYQNYYWIEQGLPTIEISGVLASDIIGKATYTTPVTATPANFTLTTGHTIILLDDPDYLESYVVENVGGCAVDPVPTDTLTGGIRLVPKSADFTSGTVFEFLPWDGLLELSTGRVIYNEKWDDITWETQTQPSLGDYITIERGSVNRNAWSRTNKWFHIDAITSTLNITSTSFPTNATRALRPIIQFIADLTLWNSGLTFKAEINYGFRNEANGSPMLLANYVGQQLTTVNSTLGIDLTHGVLVCFFNDSSEFDVNDYPWDMFNFDTITWDSIVSTHTINEYIFQVYVEIDGSVTFNPYTSWDTPVVDGDIVFILENGPYDAALSGETWYYETGSWQRAANDKVALNQPPLFQLYDHNGVRLDDEITYPDSSFTGSEIFSYKVNEEPGVTVDPVLKFPLVYSSLGQATDIIFQNDLTVDRYTYNNQTSNIDGYYYYTTILDPVLYNNWNLHQPCACDNITPTPEPFECLETSKQRVIDKYVVGYGVEYQFKLSVTPFGYPGTPDIIVIVNGTEVKSAAEQTGGYTIVTTNNNIYVDLTTYLTTLFINSTSQAPAVEIQTYTHDLLDPDSAGYFEIPQQLEANPNQDEVSEISGSNLIQHFASIISNQLGATGTSFGGSNNYRDSRKNRSLGTYILQNVCPLLKTMLVSSSDELSFVEGVRFSQNEYTKFKNRYLTTALQLINTGFNPVQYHNNEIVVSAWVEEILKVVNISKEFSNAFAYSYMIANGSPYKTETLTVPVSGTVSLSNYIDLSDPKNALYIYDTTGQERLLIIGDDYEIVSTNLVIDIQFTANMPAGNTATVYFYKNPLPAYVASTPSKIGAYPTYVPRIELDTTYVNPTDVIIGHDGSKTPIYGDYRDDLLLELEKRIYNLIQHKFRHQYYLPLRIESVKSGYFRQTRYTRDEYLDITESFLNRWSAKNRANYRANDWATESIESYVVPSFVPGVGNIWKLYNYADAVDIFDIPLNLPGNWKGIFQYYYDTYYPDTRPWEMLGLSEQPSWWQFEYGAPVLNLAGQEVWASTASGNSVLYDDLEAGIIRQGPSAIYNPDTLEVQPQEMWARPGLSGFIPVDGSGEIISVMNLFGVAFSGNYYEPFDGFDKDWTYGDGAPVEQAWMSTTSYTFSVQEFLYLMKPAAFGQLLWDTYGTERSPGTIDITGIDGPVLSNQNWQYVQNDIYENDNPLFSWTRLRNADQVVHAETIDGEVNIRLGYQRWISDRILFLNMDVSDTFGQKIRTLDVNLANKFAGFTNKDTTNAYIESSTPGTSVSNLIIPSNNFEVVLHKSPSVETYSYSGVIIRALADGTFVVYGYDLLNSEFIVLDRSTDKLIDVSIGGTPSPFLYYTAGSTYAEGDIVRYNGVYYLSLTTQTLQKFDSSGFQKLKALPVEGGISVSYKPISKTTTTKVPYGSILKTPQDVFDLLIGWGEYLKSQGWKFDEVSQETNMISDWLSSAKQFLFWLNTNWAPDAAIQLSPLANKATLTVPRGYPDDIEKLSNGVYSILDKSGVAIAPNNTSTIRDGQTITVEPSTLAAGGIYYLQVNTSETEHVLIFDNTTNFNDIVYSPLLRARQQRLRFNGFRSNGWYGKMEAPGYMIIGDELVPNFDTIVSDMRYYYDPNVTIDNQSLEDLGRHLIGYESKSYLDNLQVSNDVQYLFYQGAIRQKGTSQAFEKLFRSTKVQGDEIIEVFEEWALKLGDFGNTIEQVSTEFILTPEQNTGEVVVARMNYIPSLIGFVKQINILNAQNTYTKVPAVVISAPDADPLDPELTQPLRQAKAYAVLDSNGVISRIDITDQGYGYLTAPDVTINANGAADELDRLYSVWQGQIVSDTEIDNIIDIDIDETDVWVVRPNDPAYSLEFPLTNRIDYPLPNAGYVNFNDVDLNSFDVSNVFANWGSTNFNPIEGQSLWVAKTFTEDWGVYKLVNILPNTYSVPNWRIQEDAGGSLLLLLDLGTTIVPQFSQSATGKRTDFGNSIVLQQEVNSEIPQDLNFVVTYVPYSTEDYDAPGTYTDPTTLVDYNAYYLQNVDGENLTSDDIGDYESLTSLLLFNTLRFLTSPVAPSLPAYININDHVWVDNVDDKWAVFSVQGNPGVWDISVWDPEIINTWGNNAGWDVTGPLFLNPHRIQEGLIDTTLFQSASVFASSTGSELVQLPIYDPFKNILPGPARQNIRYMSLQDPAKYNVTADERLFSENINFSKDQVGQLWWDLSSVRYVYYEQPVALDGTETANDNLIYRRDRWAQIFPGSTIDIYEWVSSSVPPEEYTGTGTPRDVTTYVEIETANRFTNSTEVTYYFWVLNPTDLPSAENRTLPAVNVTRILQAPKAQGYSYFTPIQQTSTNNSYLFYNVQEILAYQGNNVQIKYRLSQRNEQEHTQWSFFREGDSSSVVADQYWNKMVDSLCGYTKVLPPSNEYTGLIYAENLPWDVYGWDVSSWDVDTTTTTPVYGEILPVPDPTLSEREKYGIKYRPRQGMFTDLYASRKVFVQSANELLKYISIRDDNPSWNTGVLTDDYWAYTNWYAAGYEDVVPTIVFQTLIDANAALLAGQLIVGDIVQVTNGTIDGRFTLYAVTQVDTTVSTLSLEEVGIENSAIELLDTVYTAKNKYGLSVELRQLLDAFRTQVMVDDYLVDQNELFFSMINYVMSEQRIPDWVFKTSYIYIRENNVPLAQSLLYTEDQIDNVISFITDSKPYHTHIRDYTSIYNTSDIAPGIASDTYLLNMTLRFGPPEVGFWDAACDGSDDPGPWDMYGWDSCALPLPVATPHNILDAETLISDIEQFVSREDVYTVPLTFFDASKIGLSELYPYTLDFNSINQNDPQTFVTPENVVGVQIGTDVLIYGQDYYVEYNNDTTYTIYFYEDPGVSPVPEAVVWFDGGSLSVAADNSLRNEIAVGFPKDSFVVNVDTALPANDVSSIVGPTWAPATVAPYVGWGDSWEAIGDPAVSSALIDAEGTDEIPWDTPLVLTILPYTISYKENLNINNGASFYRNADIDSGILVENIQAPTTADENITSVTVSARSDIFPDPLILPGVIWVNGERIEYRNKEPHATLPNTWVLRLLARGSMGTAPTFHNKLTNLKANGYSVLTVPTKVWIEKDNTIVDGNTTTWNAIDSDGAPASIVEWNNLTSYSKGDWVGYLGFVYSANFDIVAGSGSPVINTDWVKVSATGPIYTDITLTPVGGLWYSTTPQALFLKDAPGRSIP